MGRAAPETLKPLRADPTGDISADGDGLRAQQGEAIKRAEHRRSRSHTQGGLAA
jgi:hypothetical protein